MALLTHFDRYATITIQGGGVYGLSLLGQLSKLVEDYEIVPIALAGNSAGAIIATLYWAGLSPEVIKRKFQEASKIDPGQSSSKLMGLLGPFDPRLDGEFDFEKFQAMKQRFDGYLAAFDSQFTVEDFSKRSQEIGPLWVWLEKTCQWISALLKLRKASVDVSPHVPNNGIFRGDFFEETIDLWIRDSPNLAKFLINPGSIGQLPRPEREGGRHLTFGDLAKLPEPPDEPFLPLFLTATNLTKSRLEVINSFDGDYYHWPIGRAVRASAGFPIFFRPVAVEGHPVGCWYVDGGLISNFPSWVFGPKFRSSLSADRSGAYKYLSSFPWLNVGLRVVDSVSSEEKWDGEFGDE
jgi:predicted acylesterase/phospholipase RssA